QVNGSLVVNPTWQQLEKESDLDLVVAASESAIIMVEAGASEVGEPRILDALDLAHQEIRRIIAAQRDLVAKAGKPKAEVQLVAPDPDLDRAVRARALPLIQAALAAPEKLAREDALRGVTEEVAAALLEQYPERGKEIGEIVQTAIKDEVRRRIVAEGRRPDGRTHTDIRELSIAVGLLPRAHGSGLFQRGQTQVLTVATLGTGEDEQIIDDISLRTSKRFMHHYSFPPFSVGEVRPLRGPGRREVGHGLLVERALRPMIPDRMAREIAEPRTQLSPFAPRIITIEINPEKIREVIGPGGKVINKITAETGVKIDIEQDGRVLIASVDEKAAQKATAMIEAIVREVKVGEIYLGRVTRLMNFGAFVEVLPGKEGLVHISE